MAVEKTGIDLAVGRLTSKKIHNVTFVTPSLIGALMGMQNYWAKNAPGRMPSIRKGKVGGGVVGAKMKTNFLVGKPKWTGVNAMDPVYKNRELDLTKRAKVIQGEMLASAAQFGEPFDKYELDLIQTEEELDNWVVKVAGWSAEAYVELVQDQIFPAQQQVGGAGNPPGVIDTLMAFSYPLQSGYAGNEKDGAYTPYMYLGIDLNADQNKGIKAINVGSDTAPFVLTPDTLQERLIMPLKSRGSKCDLRLYGTADFMAMRAAYMGTIRQNIDGNVIKIPGEFFQTQDGAFHLLEPGIDKLPYPEVYVGDSETLAFGLPDDPGGKPKHITDVPMQPTMELLQGYTTHAFVNENPRMWGRAYRTVRS